MKYNLFKTSPVGDAAGIYQIFINDNSYIGSSMCIRKRLNGHRAQLKKNKHHGAYLQHSFNKYGEGDTFYSIIYEFSTAPSRKELLEKEKEFIELYDPVFNSVKDPTIYGGNIVTCVPVYKYTLNGDYVESYPSISDATRATGAGGKAINGCIQESGCGRSAAGFQWSYERHEKIPAYLNGSSKSKIKSVYQYSIEGDYIGKFESIAECIRTLYPNKDFTTACASLSCHMGGKGATFNGYRFNYEKFDKLDNSQLLEFSRNYPIIQSDMNGNKIKLWESAAIAERELGIKTQLSDCVNGRVKSVNKFRWSRLV